MGVDFWIVLRWWGTLFLVGAIAFPLTKRLFSSWYDQGYFFAKAVGMAVVTYLVYLSGMLHLFPFTSTTVYGSLFVIFVLGATLHRQSYVHKVSSLRDYVRSYSKVVLRIGIEEVSFFILLLFWSWVKGHEPSIHGLEKFMDFGFMKSILDSRYFPAADMWYAGYPINYYYFGHTVVAVLTKLSGIDLVYTFNLMLATIFALCFTMSFSIGKQLSRTGGIGRVGQIIGGILTAFLVTLAGNMQTIYAFTKGYTGENVKPFWQLLWPLGEFVQKLPEGLERYWYANATRFIPFTIHEFPSYSFVVSDIHGHVMSIPFVLLAIALLIMMFGITKHEARISNVIVYVVYGLLIAILLMTNALDGPIYLGLFIVLSLITQWKKLSHWPSWIPTGVVSGIAVLASVPFMSKFSSFVSGVALNCPPAFLTNRKIGILLFEGVEKCQHSPLWMVWLLWGFFIYCGGYFLVSRVKYQVSRRKLGLDTKITQIDVLLMVLFFFAIALIVFPEFFYFKDIYPAHFRSNTMFKLGYQAFIMLSIISGYVIANFLFGDTSRHGEVSSIKYQVSRKMRTVFFILLVPQLFLVSIFPIFSVRSYFDSLRTYKGLDGLVWLKNQYPDDWAGIMWLNTQVSSVTCQVSWNFSFMTRDTCTMTPVIVEADGDSYTDHARFSAFTGLPAVIGWPVHEWLWRGTYDVVAPRREEVRIIYESDDLEQTRGILGRYGVRYIVVGQLEREKFTAMNTEKFSILGSLVFDQGQTQIYEIPR